jgi:hypothetical protein
MINILAVILSTDKFLKFSIHLYIPNLPLVNVSGIKTFINPRRKSLATQLLSRCSHEENAHCFINWDYFIFQYNYIK